MNTMRNIALAIALTATVTVSQAAVRASHVRPGDWSTSSDTAFVPLNAGGSTTISFNLPADGKRVLTYSAECAAIGPTPSWLDIDVLVNGSVVAPTSGDDQVFCSSPGTVIFTRASITLAIDGVQGNNNVRIRARKNGSPTVLWLGASSLVVHD